MAGFNELQIQQYLIEQLSQQSIIEPTEIQQLAIPAIRTKQDVIVQSVTGSGKTLAYVLPALEQVDASSKNLQVLIIAPTRELSMQIYEEINKLMQGQPIRCQAVIGGAAMARQVDKLKLHPQIIVGTPGRMSELMKIKKLTMAHLKIMIIDEVDQVFELSAIREMEYLLSAKQKSSQMICVSATIPTQLESIIGKWMKNPLRLRAGSPNDSRVASTIDHEYILCEQRDKIDTLRRLVRLLEPQSAIVFVNEISDLAEIVAKIRYVGLSIEAIHSQATKQDRASTMRLFRENKFQLLLATDMVARGLDIPDVTHVFHMDPATDADHYLHRVGRTGRMGRKGTSVSIIAMKEKFIMEKFEKALGIRIVLKSMNHGKLTNVTHSTQAQLHKPRAAVLSSKQKKPNSGSNVRVSKNKGAPKWLKAKAEKKE